jgi:hypothetical protein
MADSPKRRGRPRKVPQSAGLFGDQMAKVVPDHLRDHVRDLMGVAVPAARTRNDRFYADQAEEVVAGLAEDRKNVIMPEDPVLAAKIRLGMDWILQRRTVLSELGRMLTENPTKLEIARFQNAVEYIASRHDKITAKAAAGHVRRLRLGKTKRRDRVAALHHDFNAAINEHRLRYPESTWADVRRALKLTMERVERR